MKQESMLKFSYEFIFLSPYVLVKVGSMLKTIVVTVQKAGKCAGGKTNLTFP